jgi:pimeloyl-ACP methyl ester carboxylesterase
MIARLLVLAALSAPLVACESPRAQSTAAPAFSASAAGNATAGTPPASATTRSSASERGSGAIDPEASNYEYPFPVRFFSFDAQRQPLRMAYLDVLPTAPANGKAVLLLHGKNFSAAYWKPTIDVLAAGGFRVIAPDQIGFGKSSKPDAHQYSFAGLASYTRELLRSLRVERASVVGHSMGGMLATRYGLLFPEAVEKLVLVNPIGLEDYGALVPYRPVDFWYQRELENTPEKIRDYQKVSYFAGDWRPEYEPLIELLAGWTRHPNYRRVAWASALTYEMILTQPVVHDFPRLRVPTRLIIGLRDRTAIGKDLLPTERRDELGRYDRLAEQAKRAIPDAELVLLDGVGHLPQVEAFDRYRDALLEFLRR